MWYEVKIKNSISQRLRIKTQVFLTIVEPESIEISEPPFSQLKIPIDLNQMGFFEIKTVILHMKIQTIIHGEPDAVGIIKIGYATNGIVGFYLDTDRPGYTNSIRNGEQLLMNVVYRKSLDGWSSVNSGGSINRNNRNGLDGWYRVIGDFQIGVERIDQTIVSVADFEM